MGLARAAARSCRTDGRPPGHRDRSGGQPGPRRCSARSACWPVGPGCRRCSESRMLRTAAGFDWFRTSPFAVAVRCRTGCVLAERLAVNRPGHSDDGRWKGRWWNLQAGHPPCSRSRAAVAPMPLHPPVTRARRRGARHIAHNSALIPDNQDVSAPRTGFCRRAPRSPHGRESRYPAGRGDVLEARTRPPSRLTANGGVHGSRFSHAQCLSCRPGSKTPTGCRFSC